ncbi:PfaB family protein [Dolichospermum sp. ST_con]|nr:PfaB family protein [Dolichospermum sp. ST_con]MDD1417854.1 PfaB family protein [Dolichospermum sp. ST_sed1]MDD1423091.1 PfaB family protein [Dolichospermum sp. ST_sed9]MDD1429848.1 PfaB family protein [Dolichospermum sp. ST_sed6]MDD1439070.1 PfaB family protein [Dolichospermum sp. ST_sed3]MDD1446266.1 PfaB family protein [Dolichospermum sp. ST_sed8]MDD1459907.1 PfaB family protein [Dolichospermum sp. ST_sed2]MDD1465128.1 PfaB family protein [Dolichospermum sp. ST_sed5]MDD1471515.1 PfaB 
MIMTVISQNQKLAIVGMDCFVNNSPTLNKFERLIYESKQNSITSPDYQQTPLSREMINSALKDAQIQPETKIALIIISPTEDSAKLANYISAELAFFAEEKSILSALDVSQKLLTTQQVEAVLIVGIDENYSIEINTGVYTFSYDENAKDTIKTAGAAAVVLQLHETAKQQNHCIYAVIDGLSVVKHSPNHPETVTQSCQEAFQIADVKAADIGYLEVVASGIPDADTAEIQGLISAYHTGAENLSCGIGSVKANIGNTQATAGLFSLIKTALCLYHRYIPGVPQWSNPKQPEIWRGSPFYVAVESKPWFLEPGAIKRVAAVNLIAEDNIYGHLILSEEISQVERSNQYLAEMPYYLFPIAADDRASLLTQITTLQQNLTDIFSLSQLASDYFQKYQQYQQSTYALAILARHPEELKKEIERAIQGVKIAFATGKDWQTPLGSYFTVNPQGKKGHVAFVYPGSFTSYIGLGRNIFRLFPQLYDDVVIRSVYNRVANIEKILYPRSINKLSRRQLESIEQTLIDDPVSMLESEVGIAGLMTAILKNYFQVQSPYAFGYSLGETSMMLSQGIWTSFKSTSDYLNSSQLFKTQLSGPKNAVRQHWGLPLIYEGKSEEFWSNYILICSPSEVREVLKHEDRVYMPLINTPEEVVIAGETKACQRVIETLKCDAFPTSINHVIHCEPMQSEYDELVKVNTLPTQSNSATIFYSAAKYSPINIDSHLIGKNIATALCHQLDFPRLVNHVYDDNIRIFIEVGVGGNCSRWISEILKHKQHLTVSVNRRGVDDHTSIIKALAKLFSHRVELDLSPLYSLPNIKIDQDITYKNDSFLQNNSLLNYERKMKSIPHYQSLNDNNTRLAKAHGFLLQSRQTSLQQLSLFLQQQLDLYKRMVIEAKKIK